MGNRPFFSLICPFAYISCSYLPFYAPQKGMFMDCKRHVYESSTACLCTILKLGSSKLPVTTVVTTTYNGYNYQLGWS